MRQNRFVKTLRQTGLLLAALALTGALHIVSAQTIISRSDFSGDNLSDFVFFNSVAGEWLIHSTDGTLTSVYHGIDGDTPVAADYDGDNIIDVAVMRSVGGAYNWYILQSSNSVLKTNIFGNDGDVPVKGDFDGDGSADVAVWRATETLWYILNSSTGLPSIITMGTATDKPVPADYDGDGITDVAVVSISENSFTYVSSLTNLETSQELLSASARRQSKVYVPADYDGDGKADIAVFYETDGLWLILESSTASYRYEQIGTEPPVCDPTGFMPCAVVELPLPGDYDHDGKVDPSLWNSRAEKLVVLGSLSGLNQFPTHTTSDMIPVSAFFMTR